MVVCRLFVPKKCPTKCRSNQCHANLSPHISCMIKPGPYITNNFDDPSNVIALATAWTDFNLGWRHNVAGIFGPAVPNTISKTENTLLNEDCILNFVLAMDRTSIAFARGQRIHHFLKQFFCRGQLPHACLGVPSRGPSCFTLDFCKLFGMQGWSVCRGSVAAADIYAFWWWSRLIFFDDHFVHICLNISPSFKRLACFGWCWNMGDIDIDTMGKLSKKHVTKDWENHIFFTKPNDAVG